MTLPNPLGESPAAGRRPVGVLLAWLVILGSAGSMVIFNARGSSRSPASNSVQLELIARYAVGCREILGGPAASTAVRASLSQAAAYAKTPKDLLRRLILIEELE